MGVDEILERLLRMVEAQHRPSAKQAAHWQRGKGLAEAGRGAWELFGLAYRYFGQIFERALLPRVIDKPLPSAVQGMFWMGRDRQVAIGPRVVAG